LLRFDPPLSVRPPCSANGCLPQILAIVASVFLTLSVKHGFGAKLGDPFTHDTSLVLKYIAIQVPIVTLSTTIARSAFILYLLGILGTNKHYQIALWTVLAIQLAGNIVSAVLPLSICRNVNILWDPTVKTTCGNSVAVINFAYFSNSKSAVWVATTRDRTER